MLTKTYFRRKLAQACGLGLVLSAAVACAPQQNVLTKEEVADGWQLLFDGKTLDQWKDYNGEELTMPWHVVDGCIQAKGDGSDLAGYIVTKKQYENFILDWDWKLSHGGNSGMIYHVVEDPYFKVPYVTGPEYQLIDNEGWEEVNAPNKLEEWQKLGVDYAMHLPDPDSLFVNPQGEWNSSRIVFDNGHVEHWLNGHKILEFEAWTDDWFARFVPQPEDQGAAPQGRPRGRAVHRQRPDGLGGLRHGEVVCRQGWQHGLRERPRQGVRLSRHARIL